MSRGIAAFFEEQAPVIAATAKKRYQKRLDAEVQKDDSVDIDWSDLIEVIAPDLEAVYIAGAKESADDLDVSPFDKLNERAAKYAKKRGAELVGMKYDADGNLIRNPNAKMAITETTRNRLREMETQAFEEGLSPAQLEEQVQTVINDRVRARLIADTDLAMAQSEGSMTAWLESGLVTGKQSLLSQNHGRDDDCDENADAGIIALGAEFPSGHLTTPFHPTCDCDVAAVME